MHRIITYLLSLVVILIASSCQKDPSKQHPQAQIRMSIEKDPQTLDPRQVRSLESATVVHMLYEGLMRLDEHGKPIPAIAESVSVSEDLKFYTFRLRKSYWSNGEPLTAKDFADTWKSMLDPDFPAPNANLLYAIKGAKEAKEGKRSLDEVGIRVPDPQTLAVELETPTPYFLNLTTSYFYAPVSPQLHVKEGQRLDDTALATNGPFKIGHWDRNSELEAVKNPYYWNAPQIHLDKILLIVSEPSTALALYNQGELDWTGSPLSTIPADALPTLKRQGHIQISPGMGTFLFRLNIEKPPFDDVRVRQALSLALNRYELVEHVLQGDQIPATGFIPDSLFAEKPPREREDIERARKLMKAVVTEKGALPTMTLCYGASERYHKIAQVVQQQWKEAFGVDVILQSCESKIYFDRMKSGDYQMGLRSWFGDFRDPIAFLEVFKYRNNGTNNTGWENSHYKELLELSSLEKDEMQREKLLMKAESILLDEKPIIPLFYSTYSYLKSPTVKGVIFSELGYLDFRNAYIEIINE